MVVACGAGSAASILGRGATCRAAASGVVAISECQTSATGSSGLTWPAAVGSGTESSSLSGSAGSLLGRRGRDDAGTSSTSPSPGNFFGKRSGGRLKWARLLRPCHRGRESGGGAKGGGGGGGVGVGGFVFVGWQHRQPDRDVRLGISSVAVAVTSPRKPAPGGFGCGAGRAPCAPIRLRSAQRIAAAQRDEASASVAASGVMMDDAAQGRVLEGITEWELDFCSRPILDARGKKIWELLVCDKTRTLEYAEFFPNNKINSANLKDAISRVIRDFTVQKPTKIRFFRSQMQTIISKACTELGIQPIPSQRCVTLLRWLGERLDTVYKLHPGFTDTASPLLMLDAQMPQDLPDTLRGEQWAFVQLPLEVLEAEIMAVRRGQVFGDVYDLDVLGIDLRPDTMIPGVAVASQRATALAAYTSALELACIKVDPKISCLLLQTNVSERWRYAFYRKSRQADEEARAWEDAKAKCKGLHFLAVQSDFESDDCSGFWLLFDTEPPQI